MHFPKPAHYLIGATTNNISISGFDPLYGTSEAALIYYSENDEWELMKPVRIGVSERTLGDQVKYGQVVMELRIARRNLFYSMVFVFPNALLYLMSSLVYFLPVESGEKVSFSITILLAEIVSFGTLTEILPSSSLNFPLLAWFIFAIVCHTALGTFFAVFSEYNL